MYSLFVKLIDLLKSFIAVIPSGHYICKMSTIILLQLLSLPLLSHIAQATNLPCGTSFVSCDPNGQNVRRSIDTTVVARVPSGLTSEVVANAIIQAKQLVDAQYNVTENSIATNS